MRCIFLRRRVTAKKKVKSLDNWVKKGIMGGERKRPTLPPQSRPAARYRDLNNRSAFICCTLKVLFAYFTFDGADGPCSTWDNVRILPPRPREDDRES